MKRLNRALANEPECLKTLAQSGKSWDNVSSKQKKKIWLELDKFQHQYCVYCESPASQGEHSGHIEHFFHKGKKPDGSTPYAHLTFDWGNLFGCCPSTEHCGHYKDQLLPGGKPRAYDPQALIKPDADDPEIYLQFLQTGDVQIKADLSDLANKKATVTIKALNLQAPTLNDARSSKIQLYQNRLLELNRLPRDDEGYQQEYDMIKDEAMFGAYSTAVEQACFR